MLPTKYQKLVRLRYFHELSYEEIAVELEAPLGTVKAQLHRARELLYDLVKNKKEHI
jgi:RNA polymerase sigma-70 factor (ECF subfamily)